MQEIQGKTRTVQELLGNAKYGIDYYQREYQWQTKNISELIDDLTNRFLEDYQPGDGETEFAKYGYYFLGSILISENDTKKFIVDGQQRLTSLTLLLIFLNNLQKKVSSKTINIESLIFSENIFGRSFNLDVPERNACMEALFGDEPFDATQQPDSIANLVGRYNDIEELFPEELRDEALPFFIFWLQTKVLLVEIKATSDNDAYLIFETMNDRGLSLSPTEMLKGYLLANVTNLDQRALADKTIKKWLLEFKEIAKEADADFFKTWFRAQYAQDIRDRKKDAKPKDFDLIGTEYHRWIRNNAESVGLKSSNSFFKWINNDLNFYARIYKQLLDASKGLTEGWERVRYNADHGFTLQFQLLMAPLKSTDTEEIVKQKVALVAWFIDSWLNRRLWHFKSNSYSNMSYGVFQITKKIRGLDVKTLRTTLIQRFEEVISAEELDFSNHLYLHKQNSKTLHRQLARMTDWLERECGMNGNYQQYIVRSGKNAYEIEHIWANHFEEHTDEFSHEYEFRDYRNRLGGLVLLPKSVNASLQDKPYSHKVNVYSTQNLLAASLHPQTYENKPKIKQMQERTGLDLKPIYQEDGKSQFTKVSFDQRFALYRDIAEQMWSVESLKELV